MLEVYEEDDRFYLGYSTLVNGGLGVFAKRLVQKNETLEVVGVMIEKGSDTDLCTHYANDYKFAARPKNFTRYIIPMGLAAIVNHSIDKSQINMIMEYQGGPKKSIHSSNLVLKVIKPIFPDEECFHYYGDEWNNGLKWEKEALSTLTSEEQEWNKFISHRLYNLDLFDKILKDNDK